MKLRNYFLSAFCWAVLLPAGSGIAVTPAFAGDEVNISDKLPYVDVIHKGEMVRIQRNPDTENIIDLDYAITSRPCPPYCIQPAKLADGVETIAELEVLNYLKKISAGDKNILLIDSREAKWLSKGMIPGAINIPWQRLYNKTASAKEITNLLLLHFDVAKIDGLWNFQDAKTLVFYCNGNWCGQSSTNIKALLALGYPARKLKWYRGGMQAWKSLGLTTVKP